jgi:glycerol uptake facilitator-like aquaporin
MFEKYLVEFFGTFLFVFIILLTKQPVLICITLAAILISFPRSHINPAVTIALSTFGELPTSDILPYCLSQSFGGLAAVQFYKVTK